MRKILFFCLAILSFVFIVPPASAHGDKVLYLFYGKGCPHCAKEEAYLSSYLGPKYPNLKIERLEVWSNMKNARVLSEAAKRLNITTSGVPVTIVGDKYFVGYNNDDTTGARIESAVMDYLFDENCEDFVAPIIKNNDIENSDCVATSSANKLSQKISLPIFGEVDLKNMSLPFLTFAIAAIDGFNPCAMWVLIFLISLLLGMNDRKKMWILGSAFIVSSALVYFLFLSAWLNLFLFLGFIFWIRIIVAVVALISGGYHLKEFFTNKAGQCEVVGTDGKKKTIERLKKIVSTDKFYLALGGIIVLAAAINLVELVCSAGLPAIYTQVLALSNLPPWEYYLYLVFYIIIFMADDMLVFFIAMKTLKLRGVTSKYTRYSGLIGGVIMLLVGALLILKPGWLMFG
jgi:glutaredoxin